MQRIDHTVVASLYAWNEANAIFPLDLCEIRQLIATSSIRWGWICCAMFSFFARKGYKCYASWKSAMKKFYYQNWYETHVFQFFKWTHISRRCLHVRQSFTTIILTPMILFVWRVMSHHARHKRCPLFLWLDINLLWEQSITKIWNNKCMASLWMTSMMHTFLI